MNVPCFFCEEEWTLDTNQFVFRRGDGKTLISVESTRHYYGRNGRFVCHPCAEALEKIRLDAVDPDDLVVRDCEECLGHGGIKVSKYSGSQQCYTCEGLGIRFRIKTPLELLAGAAE